ncbi:MAG: hypothetical protein C5B58_11195 [Acidobacteria bacterium]|nr:MAG: hypothetical protein C5B58_11195 [Acidobacteriota bacterium]
MEKLPAELMIAISSKGTIAARSAYSQWTPDAAVTATESVRPSRRGTVSTPTKSRRRQKAPESTKPRMTNLTVLVVDDDPSFLRAATRLIRSAGFKVVGFERPSALLASDLPKTNACIVLDVHLPEMTGVELYKTLSESNRILPAIMITGRDDPETKRLIGQVDPVAALFKPIEEKALFEAIDRALALSKNIPT